MPIKKCFGLLCLPAIFFQNAFTPNQNAPCDEAQAKLQAITQAYIKRFDQQAVMRSDTPACTQFITRK